MRAVNIKWDVTTDGAEDMTKEDMDEILSTFPAEVEIPDNLIDNNEDFDEDYYYSDISDWLSDEYGFCHFGFELVNQQTEQESMKEMEEKHTCQKNYGSCTKKQYGKKQN